MPDSLDPTPSARLAEVPPPDVRNQSLAELREQGEAGPISLEAGAFAMPVRPTPRRPAQRLAPIVITCLGLLAAGCGTTVPSGTQSVAGTRGSESAPVPGGTDSQVTGSGPDGGTGLADVAGGAPSSAPTGVGAAAGGEGVGPIVRRLPDSIPASGRGYDAKTMRIGFNTINNADTFFKSIGASITFGDMKADAEAILAGINARGGVLGRKVVGVYHDEDVSEATTNPTANAQKTCSALTQDNKVVAAAINDTAGDDNDNFYSCMKKADTPFFSAADMLLDEQWIGQYRGYLHSTQGPSINSFAPVFVQRLGQMRYFSSWNTATSATGTGPVKLGLLFADTAIGHRSAAAFARLSASQVASSTSFFYPPTVAEGAAAMQSAVLKFASAGISHVIAPDAAVNAFMIAAEQQRYRPRYAVNSLMQLSSMQAPAAQKVGAVGVGWQPLADSGKVPQHAAAQACLSELKRGGVNYGGSVAPTSIALHICDQIRLITESAKAGGGFSTAALMRGLAKVGPTFQPATTWRSGFSATRSDVVGAVRDVAYNAGCSCFAYTSSRLWPV
jgi:hypothetical protein